MAFSFDSKFFSHHHPSQSLPRLMRDLLHRQKIEWSQLREGCDAFTSVRTKVLSLDGCSVVLQFNPKRIISSGAKVDAQSISARRCFLCTAHLPEEQKGILYGDNFIILCNPAPIFHEHFTISNVEHTPQLFLPSIDIFLELARDISPAFSVFYNGARCGASAPDHMHFQAAASGVMPIEKNMLESFRKRQIDERGSAAAYLLTGLIRSVILIEGGSPADVSRSIERLFSLLKNNDAEPEPMINILAKHEGGIWRVIIFPRTKHRPDMYFREDESRVLLSPASVDMGGLLITPLEKDFLAADERMIESVYHEVSYSNEELMKIICGERKEQQ